jgi:hypothetical protein
MDEVKWRFYSINWTLYRDITEGLWMAFSSDSDSHSTAEKTNMESWLAGRQGPSYRGHCEAIP